MKQSKLIILLLSLLLVACRPNIPETQVRISPIADMPDGRTAAISFAHDACGFILCGRGQDGKLHNDLYRYEVTTNTWTQQSSPLKARVHGSACRVGEDIYVGLGFAGTIYRDTAYLRDWWRYTPATDTWTRLKDYPCEYTVGAVAYTEGERIYCLYGFAGTFSKTIACYDIRTDSWTLEPQPSNLPLAVLGATGDTWRGRHFFGTGYSTHNQDYWYEITDGAWQARANVPGGGQSAAVTTHSERYIYLSGGRHWGGVLTTGQVYSDLLQYDAESDRWCKAGSLPTAAENQSAWSIGGIAYIGLGEAEDGTILSTIYRIEE